MFNHNHPYPPFIPDGTTKLIVGTLPPPRFTIGSLRDEDVNFCYGSRDGQLWPILDRIFQLNLIYENSEEAIRQRKDFLKSRKIGICDIVDSAKREKVDASDLGMQQVKLRNLLKVLKTYPNIDTLLFTGGNSKNGPEYFFRKQLKENGISYTVLDDVVPRIHQFQLNRNSRIIRTISLTAPSGAANRAVGSLEAYKTRKKKNPDYNTIDFRVEQYSKFF